MGLICPAETEDMKEILALQKTAYITEAEIYNDFNIPPLLQTLEEIINEAKDALVLKTVDRRKIIGSVRGQARDGTCYIGKLMVLPDCRNKGIGKDLMKAIEDAFPDARYELFTGHLSFSNLALYESLGYKRFKTQKINEALELVYLEKIRMNPEIHL